LGRQLFITIHFHKWADTSMHFPISRQSMGALCFIAFALIDVSCSSRAKLFAVRGKVLFEDKPAEGVVVMFLSPAESDLKAARPMATTAEDGTFSLVTEEEDGAPAGDYIVTMLWQQNMPVPTRRKGESISGRLNNDPVDKLRGRYLDRKKGFNVRIEKKDNELPPFKLH
jgi:hypothetical protein